MRKLSFIFIIVLAMAIFASAQTPPVLRIFDEGTKLAQNAQYEKAIENYRKAVLLAENEQAGNDFLARIHFNIGVCLYHLRKPSEAVREYTEAIRLSKSSYEKAFYALGMAQFELKNWPQAEQAFLKAISLNKRNGETWFDLAQVYLEEKDFEAAARGFQNAIALKSVNYADAYNNLGVISALKHDFQSAEKEFETALIESNGKSVEARNNLQFCKYYKQNFSKDLIAKLEFSKYKE